MLVCSEVEVLLLCFLEFLRVLVVDVEKKFSHRQKTLI